LIFSIHTYYALLLKLIAAEIVYLYGGGKFYRSYIAELDDAYSKKGLEGLKEALQDLESGSVFKRLMNIENFLEGDYFSWHLDVLDGDLADLIAELAKLPRYVAEYLISEFAGSGGDWEAKLREFIRKHYYEPEEKEVVKHRLVVDGTVKLIDELRVVVDIKTHIHVGIIQSLDIWAEVPVDIVEGNRATLVNGMWGLITLKRSDPIEVFGRSIAAVVTDFYSFQSPATDPRILEEARQYFTLDEWVEALMNTIGLDPSVYSPRQRLVLLSRLVPLVEGNVSMAEFGPRQTGKTYLYRNASNYVRIISGGTISPAVLFYNLRTRVPGELAVKNVVVFDEVSKVRFPNLDEMMGKLKDYMESGVFERGIRRSPQMPP
jgi:ATP-dependent Lon protease